MKMYEAVTEFWHKGLLVQAGEKLEMLEVETKYIGHKIKEAVTEAAIGVLPSYLTDEPKAEPVVDAPVAEDAVEDVTANVSGKRRR